MCETLWFPDMNAEQLFESVSQALMNGVDRDASAGWGGVVHIIEKDKVRKMWCEENIFTGDGRYNVTLSYGLLL